MRSGPSTRMFSSALVLATSINGSFRDCNRPASTLLLSISRLATFLDCPPFRNVWSSAPGTPLDGADARP